MKRKSALDYKKELNENYCNSEEEIQHWIKEVEKTKSHMNRISNKQYQQNEKEVQVLQQQLQDQQELYQTCQQRISSFKHEIEEISIRKK